MKCAVSMRFSEDGSLIASGSNDGTVKILDATESEFVDIL
jgi:WD40 repeat protein